MKAHSQDGRGYAPYRNDIDALRERKEALEREIARLKDQTQELDALKSRAADLAKELDAIDRRIDAGRRSLPLLDGVRVASPCKASWDEMLGDERARFCLSCEKNVYNISAMPRDEAEQFLQQRQGQSVCIRYYQRADGTILTEDCPVGVTKKRRKKVALAVFGAGAMALAAASSLTVRQGSREVSPVPIAGSVMVPAPEPEPEPDLLQGQTIMGDWAGPEPKKAEPPPPPAPVMGRRGRR